MGKKNKKKSVKIAVDVSALNIVKKETVEIPMSQLNIAKKEEAKIKLEGQKDEREQ